VVTASAPSQLAYCQQLPVGGGGVTTEQPRCVHGSKPSAGDQEHTIKTSKQKMGSGEKDDIGVAVWRGMYC